MCVSILSGWYWYTGNEKNRNRMSKSPSIALTRRCIFDVFQFLANTDCVTCVWIHSALGDVPSSYGKGKEDSNSTKWKIIYYSCQSNWFPLNPTNYQNIILYISLLCPCPCPWPAGCYLCQALTLIHGEFRICVLHILMFCTLYSDVCVSIQYEKRVRT